ncbi:MAG: SGNH/GDSL hydrolase family protein [Ornithinibacter sp.]
MPARRVAHTIALSVIATVAVVLGVLGAQAHTVDPAPRSSASATRSASASASASAPVIPTTRVVGIGDSVMSGTACDCDGIPAVYARELAARSRGRVTAVNLGQGGSTADSTEADLKGGLVDREAVASADVVLVIVGANDLGPADDRYEAGGCDAGCYGPLVDAMRGHLTALLGDVRRLVGPHAQILVGTYWNVFPDGDPSIVPGGDAELAWSRALTADVNETICRAAESAPASCVDLAAPFFGPAGAAPLLADDGDHPNGKGVDAIVAQLLDATDVRALGRTT